MRSISLPKHSSKIPQAMGNTMVMKQLEFGQLLIQTDSHRGRLEHFKTTLDEEYRTVIAQKSLKSLGDR